LELIILNCDKALALKSALARFKREKPSCEGFSPLSCSSPKGAPQGKGKVVFGVPENTTCREQNTRWFDA